MPTIQPYLFFSGNCEEAIAFYQQALGAQLEMMMRFSDSPDPVPDGQLQPGFEDKVMHASINIGGARVMCSDGCDEGSKFDGFRLSLAFTTEDEARQAFDALSTGAKIDLPIGPTFWSPCFGMLTDRFGVGWMVTVEG